MATASRADELMSSQKAEDIVARTRAMIPLLRERAAEDEANRTVNPDTVRHMNEAGLFRVLQPRRWDRAHRQAIRSYDS